MKQLLKLFLTAVTVLALITVITASTGCGSKDKESKKKDEAKTTVKKKERRLLPKRLLDVGLKPAQKKECRKTYKAVYTKRVRKLRKDYQKDLKKLKKGSAEYKAMDAEYTEFMKPYHKRFRAKLKKILTEKQWEAYTARPKRKK